MANQKNVEIYLSIDMYKIVYIYPQMKLQAFPWVNLSLFREKPHEATILGPFLLEVPR